MNGFMDQIVGALGVFAGSSVFVEILIAEKFTCCITYNLTFLQMTSQVSLMVLAIKRNMENRAKSQMMMRILT